ncbi:helix-turn-helix domain-containing protein [Streptomyces sp. NPDC048685]|uniref:helix-turn-helix domain-containing protein n=1 Tax=Streptomyces sp. NPDC048685 TaxID=3365584 RepID=UPI00372440C4
MHSHGTPLASQVSQDSGPLTVKEAAAALRKDTSVIYREIQAGRLSAYRVGTGRGTIRISRQEFIAYLDARGIPANDLAVAL